MEKPSKALSIKQPWAWLICMGYKDIENRDWRIGREPAPGFHRMDHKLPFPSRVYVHAGKHFDMTYSLIGADHISKELGIEMWCIQQHPELFGAIIGEVDITGCVTESDSPWFVGKYGFTLANPVLYEKPIPYRGQLGFFEVSLPEVK